MRRKETSEVVRSLLLPPAAADAHDKSPQTLETNQPPQLDTDLAAHVHALKPRARHKVPPGVVDGQSIPRKDAQGQEEEERFLRNDAGGAVLL